MHTDDETYYQLKLALSENVGPITYRDLMKYFKSAREAVVHLPNAAENLARLKLPPIRLLKNNWKKLKKTIRKF